ncbi:MAG: class III extradiol ring-cleavage dioxygenase [Bacteriovorax sp.]|nr:class III extradiol ring-cleavage dioxygenase [Bacteriovorax sp.]
MTTKKLPTYFISHGGGPWPWLKKEMPYFDKLEASLISIAKEVGRPKAILMISGHWEEESFTLMANPNPPMLYDYGGFPEHTYHVKYPAPGDLELVARTKALIEGAGFPMELDQSRGFDHGTFVPLVIMYPEADVPVVQLSLKKNYDPETHYQLGKALAPLREEGILIIGSGLSYHNLREFGRGEAANIASKQFDVWLGKTLIDLPKEERHQHLLEWTKAPSARAAHPYEDHLIPLHVVVGAAENEKGVMIYHEEGLMHGMTVSSFRFGEV